MHYNSSSQEPQPLTQENKDYKPVALTSNVMKSWERIMTEELCKEVEQSIDQYQICLNKIL